MFLVDGKNLKCQVLYNNGITTTDIAKGADEASSIIVQLIKTLVLSIWVITSLVRVFESFIKKKIKRIVSKNILNNATSFAVVIYIVYVIRI